MSTKRYFAINSETFAGAGNTQYVFITPSSGGPFAFRFSLAVGGPGSHAAFTGGLQGVEIKKCTGYSGGSAPSPISGKSRDLNDSSSPSCSVLVGVTGVSGSTREFIGIGLYNIKTSVLILEPNTIYEITTSFDFSITMYGYSTIEWAEGGRALDFDTDDISESITAAPAAFVTQLMNTTLQYVDELGNTASTKFWIMIQAIFSTIKQRLKQK